MSASVERREILGHGAACFWLTGLSGSGKSTVARALEARLLDQRVLACVLDGDILRTGLCAGLGFSREDRKENVRRAGEAAALLVEAGLVVIVALISPFADDRALVRHRIGESFIEVFVDVPLECCERRDPKGLYPRARRGEIAEFTGISSPYESPESPEILLHTESTDLPSCVERLMKELRHRGVLPSASALRG